MFEIGDLVSWKGTEEYGIVLKKHLNMIKQTEDILVKFLGTDTYRDAGSLWYDSKYFVKVSDSKSIKAEGEQCR